MAASANAGADIQTLMEQLRAKTATRENLTLKLYKGPADIAILVQEQQLQNSDLMDEHWSDVWDPEKAQRQHISVRRTKEGMAITLVVVAGDKAAGKTTFFAALTGGHLHILQAFRYNRASFFNVWYAPDLQEIQELLNAPDRTEPYFQTALAHGFIHLPMAEYDFFLHDDEFQSDGDEVAPSEVVPQQDMLVKLLEIGGDFIQDLMTLLQTPSAITDSTKVSVLSNVLQYLQQCHSLAYFVNLDALFHVASQHVQMNTEKYAKTVAQFDFLNSVLPKGARVLVYCSREPEVPSSSGWASQVMQSLLEGQTWHSPNADAQAHQWETEDPSSALRHIIGWALRQEAITRQWALHLHGFYPTRHLDVEGSFEYSAVLRTLHRLLKTSTGVPVDHIGLVAQQVVNIAYDFWESDAANTQPLGTVWFTKEVLYTLLQAEEETSELDDVLHPMVMLPPMVLLDAFEEVTHFLVDQGLALQWYNGQHSDISVIFEASGLPTFCWTAQRPPDDSVFAGFRLPLHPQSRSMIRRAVDLMASVEGLKQSALGRHVLEDSAKVIAAVQLEVHDKLQQLLRHAASSGPGPEFDKMLHTIVWLLEEWVLVTRLLPNGRSQPGKLIISLSVVPEEWRSLGKCLGENTNPPRDSAVAVHVVCNSC